MKKEKFRLCVFISGRGSNFCAIVDAIEKHELPIEVVLVLSNTSKAAGLEFAREKGFPTTVVPRKPKQWSQEQFDQALVEAVKPYAPELIVLAGFMRVIGAGLISEYKHKIVNIHPSLLPSFRGLHVQQRALDAGAKFSGCSVHFVTQEVDAGPIIGQAIVPILPGDTQDTLAARILYQEHRLLPAVVNGIASGNIRVVEQNGCARVVIEPSILGAENSDFLLNIKPL